MNVAGLFETLEDGSQALEDLVSNGWSRKDISLICGDPHGDYSRRLAEGKPILDQNSDSKSASGAAAGALMGGGMGTLAGIAALMVPVIGPVIALGAMAEGLFIGAATGAQVGTLQDASQDLAMAEALVEGLRRGGCVVVAPCEDQISIDRARELMARWHAIRVAANDSPGASKNRLVPAVGERAA